jgi:1-acyl-sn-glycerol-3-phosphate acyltransferase
MRPCRRFLKAILVGLMFLAGLSIVTAVFPLLEWCGFRKAERLKGLIARGWYSLLTKILNVRVRRFGKAMQSPGLTVSNHISWLDIVILGAQGPFNFVSKREVAEWPIVGYLARQSGTLFVRRGDRDSTRITAEEMTWRLRRGQHLVLFPEGTSSRGDQILRFHARLYQPAVLANTPVQAVAIAYRGETGAAAPFVGDDDFLPHLWRMLGLSAIDVDLFFCEPIPTDGFDRGGLAQRTRGQIVEALNPQSDTQIRRIG